MKLARTLTRSTPHSIARISRVTWLRHTVLVLLVAFADTIESESGARSDPERPALRRPAPADEHGRLTRILAEIRPMPQAHGCISSRRALARGRAGGVCVLAVCVG